MSDSERRQNQRIPFIAEIIVRHNEQQWRCELEDISLKGILIEVPENTLAVQDESYDVELVLGEGATIMMKATVTHVSDRGWGMHWDNIDLDGLTHLRRLLELNMQDSSEMHRELADLG